MNEVQVGGMVVVVVVEEKTRWARFGWRGKDGM